MRIGPHVDEQLDVVRQQDFKESLPSVVAMTDGKDDSVATVHLRFVRHFGCEGFLQDFRSKRFS